LTEGDLEAIAVSEDVVEKRRLPAPRNRRVP
jgi:hypothetical protein